MIVPEGRRRLALLAGLVAALIWATSFLVISGWLAHIGPLMIAGLRYTCAGLLLMPLVLRFRRSTAQDIFPWFRLTLIGVSAYTIGNVTLFAALHTLSPTGVTLLTGLAPLVVMLSNLVTRQELPRLRQFLGVMLALFGSSIFFKIGFTTRNRSGVLLASIGVIAYTLSSLQTSELARRQRVDTMTLTAVPLVIGGSVSLLIALLMDGLPQLDAPAWFAILTLTLVHTIVGYGLFTYALRVLTALEMNALLNLSPLATALLAWAFFSERLTTIQWIALVMAIGGITLVQWQRQGMTRKTTV